MLMPIRDLQALRLLVILVALCVCFWGAIFSALAQEPTTSTGRVNPPKTNTSPRRTNSGRRGYIRRAARPKTGISRGSVSEQSDNFVALGDTFAEKSEWNAAQAAYTEAISLSPGNADAHAGLGTLYNDQGKHGDAFRPLSTARSLDPSNVLANYGLGYAYMRSLKYREAIGYFKQAISGQPDFAQAYLDLGLTYLALNDKQAALSQYEKLKEFDGESAQELLTEINKK
jgi:tetratricopeptide (TPR) repeat protein